jgi:hypothetical protein
VLAGIHLLGLVNVSNSCYSMANIRLYGKRRRGKAFLFYNDHVNGYRGAKLKVLRNEELRL